MRTIPEGNTLEISEALQGLLTRRCPTVLSDEFYAHDWHDLLDELETGGWFDIADEFNGSAGDGDRLVNLAAVSEVWGRHLVPLPFSERCFATTWLGDRTRRVATPAGIGQAWLAFPRADGFGQPQDGEGIDRFAPSLPLLLQASATSATVDESGTLLTLFAAETVGCASVALERAVAYSQSRIAYGRPIGAFQALQHLMADMHLDTEMARSGVNWAAQDASARLPVLAEVSRRTRRVIEGAIQVYGGMGFTWSAGLHYYLRHALVVEKLVAVASSGLT